MITEPKLELLQVGSLHVDSYAQREYRDKHAQAIADRWNPAKLGVFKVSRRTNGDYTVDGQHRRAAMLKLEKSGDLVPALVYEGLTIEEEAEIFLADNADNRAPGAIDIYRLSLVAKDPIVVSIQEVLDRHTLKVSYATDSGSIAAVASLRWLYESGGTVLIDRVLALVESAWGRNRDARVGQLIKALGKVIKDSTGARLDMDALAHKLSASGKPTQLMGTARTYRQATGKALWLQVAEVVVSIYNKGKTSQRVELL